jgi:signal transduction histidine kinase
MEKLVQTLSRIRANPGGAVARLDLNDLVRETVGDLQVTSNGSIDLGLKLAASRPVQADAGMLRRVLENLITNAIDAMDARGSLTIETRDGDALPSVVHVVVTDTGCGMPEEFLCHHLFRPFATTKKNGLGLGLYQCRSIVQAHGGELTATSKIGVGSVFRISLPAIAPAVPVHGEPGRPLQGVSSGQQLFDIAAGGEEASHRR